MIHYTKMYMYTCTYIHHTHTTVTHTCPIHILHACIHTHAVPNPTPTARQPHGVIPCLRPGALPSGADLRVQLTLLPEDVVQHDAAQGVCYDRDSASLGDEVRITPHELVVLTLEGYF